jgi:hypothetical protein
MSEPSARLEGGLTGKSNGGPTMCQLESIVEVAAQHRSKQSQRTGWIPDPLVMSHEFRVADGKIAELRIGLEGAR